MGFSYSFYVILAFLLTSVWSITNALELNVCQNFEGRRDNQSLPTRFTADGKSVEHTTFSLSSTETKLDCKSPQERTVSLNKKCSERSCKDTHRKFDNTSTYVRFTSRGYFHDGEHYYDKSEYCIKSISESEAKVHMCPPDCSADLSTSLLYTNNTSSSSSRVCIPKCCAVDEVLIYWKWVCKKVSELEDHHYWRPNLHVAGQSSVPEHVRQSADFKGRIHYYNHGMDCEDDEKDWFPFSEVKAPRGSSQPDDKVDKRFRLVVSSGQVKPMHYEDETKAWKELKDTKFCADGFATPEDFDFEQKTRYKDNRDHQVVMICVPPLEEEESNAKTWAFIATTIISLIFLMFIIVIYMLILDKQNLHGLTILSYTGSLFFSYLFFLNAHFISVFSDSVFAKVGLGKRGGYCMSVAILSHYFFLSTAFWLTIMNLDMVITLISSKPAPAKSKQLKKYGLYSLIAWVIPLIIIISFIVVDEKYSDRDSDTEVIVPDYARSSCFVANGSRLYYVYIPLAVILSINLLLFAVLLISFYRAYGQNAEKFMNKTERIKLFLKVFAVMGMTWFGELISWYYGDSPWPWYAIAFECYVILHPVLLFILFCTNARTLDQFEATYPLSKDCFRSLRKLKWFRKETAGENSRNGMEMTRQRESTSMTTHY